MSLKTKRTENWRRGLAGGLCCALLGVALRSLAPADGLTALSYDLLFRVKPMVRPDEAIIVYMDETSFRALEQKPANWKRSLHAELLDRLTADGAGVAVFDILFDGPVSDVDDAALTRAITRNGKVVLAAIFAPRDGAGIATRATILPWTNFLAVAAGWGLAELVEDSVIRQYYPGSAREPSLPWAAAVIAGARIAQAKSVDLSEHWLNYYGPQGTIPNLNFDDALRQRAGYFKDKYVFIGSRPKALYALGEAEAFPTPHWRWGKGLSPGVDFAATAFLNLLRREWLTRLPLPAEVLVLALGGLLCGYFVGAARPAIAVARGLAGAAALLAVALLLLLQARMWFGWSVLAFAQIPCAGLWSIGATRFRTPRARTLAPETAPVPSAVVAADGAGPAAPVVSDHTLLRCVGRGGYGEVWLARDVLGSYHAVKIVHRRSFTGDGPYEREFRGIQQYAPISRSHPGWVHVLHAGRNEAAGYFFYVMEAGDDETRGQQIDPVTYVPRTLAGELRRRGRLPLAECVPLAVALTTALEHLHHYGLVHRDIKPSNVIFVEGAPKFADIGLVTGIESVEQPVSYVGTEGYIAPEGPGTPAADVYSLGKLLFEISTGRDRREFPEPSTTLRAEGGNPAWSQFNEVLLRACEIQRGRRYASAAQLHADLLRLGPPQES